MIQFTGFEPDDASLNDKEYDANFDKYGESMGARSLFVLFKVKNKYRRPCRVKTLKTELNNERYRKQANYDRAFRLS
ncbi:MAG: hypothetical protein ACUZ8E_03650 [Candidatus Anammoxibacter sp.]